MEKESEQQPPGDDYIDKPAPGRDFLAFFPAVAGGLLLLVVGTVIWKGEYDAGAVTGLAIAAVVAGLVYWIGLKAAYGTTYRLGPEGLELRCGIVKSSFVRYSRIQDVARESSWRRMLLRGIGYQSFCNRFGDFVELKLKGYSVFLTPSDPERFIAALRERMQRD